MLNRNLSQRNINPKVVSVSVSQLPDPHCQQFNSIQCKFNFSSVQLRLALLSQSPTNLPTYIPMSMAKLKPLQKHTVTDRKEHIE